MKLFQGLLSFLLILSILSCNEGDNQNNDELEKLAALKEQKVADSLRIQKEQQWIQDSIRIYEGAEMSFPQIKDISKFNKTEFIPTLENKIVKGKNIIYCATLLFAWDGIKNIVSEPITLREASLDFNLLNSSKSYIKVLDSSEYNIKTKAKGDTIISEALFHKSLPFSQQLYSFEYKNKLKFDNNEVHSFGFNGYDHFISTVVEILYYKNDNNFVIKLIPEDSTHEIILFKTEDKHSTMAEIVSSIDKKIMIGKTEKAEPNNLWKYTITKKDKIMIPKIKFNIENHFKNIENQRFTTATKNYFILTAKQSNSFILYEKGVGVGSRAEIFAVEAHVHEEEMKPKKMIFDTPFFLMLRKTNNSNPYFAIWSENSELMQKE